MEQHKGLLICFTQPEVFPGLRWLHWHLQAQVLAVAMWRQEQQSGPAMGGKVYHGNWWQKRQWGITDFKSFYILGNREAHMHAQS